MRRRGWEAGGARRGCCFECLCIDSGPWLVRAATSGRVTASHPNSEVKLPRVSVVLRWGTTREGDMLHVLFLRTENLPFPPSASPFSHLSPLPVLFAFLPLIVKIFRVPAPAHTMPRTHTDTRLCGAIGPVVPHTLSFTHHTTPAHPRVTAIMLAIISA